MKRTQRERYRHWSNLLTDSHLTGGRGHRPRLCPSSLARLRGRPRGMSQVDWFWCTPRRKSPDERWKRNGWSGGRDRNKPQKIRMIYCEAGKWIGGVIQYTPNGDWVAYVCTDGGEFERRFTRRREAKRWVESHPMRVRP